MHTRKTTELLIIGGIAVAGIAVVWLFLNKPVSTVNNGFKTPVPTPNTNTSAVGSLLQGIGGIISQFNAPTPPPGGVPASVGVVDPNAGITVTNYGS